MGSSRPRAIKTAQRSAGLAQRVRALFTDSHDIVAMLVELPTEASAARSAVYRQLEECF